MYYVTDLKTFKSYARPFLIAMIDGSGNQLPSETLGGKYSEARGGAAQSGASLRN